MERQPKRIKVEEVAKQTPTIEKKDILATLIRTFNIDTPNDTSDDFEMEIDTFVQFVGRERMIWTNAQLISGTRWKLNDSKENENILKIHVIGLKENVEKAMKFLQQYCNKLIESSIRLKSINFYDSPGSQGIPKQDAVKEITMDIFQFNQIAGRDHIFLKKLEEYSNTKISVDTLTKKSGIVTMHISGKLTSVKKVKEYIQNYRDCLGEIYSEFQDEVKEKIHFNPEIISQLDLIYGKEAELEKVLSEIKVIEVRLKQLNKGYHYDLIHKVKTEENKVVKPCIRMDLYTIEEMKSDLEDLYDKKQELEAFVKGYSHRKLFKQMLETNKHMKE